MPCQSLLLDRVNVDQIVCDGTYSAGGNDTRLQSASGQQKRGGHLKEPTETYKSRMESTMTTANIHQMFTGTRDFTMLSKLPIAAVLLIAATTVSSQGCTTVPTQCCNAFVQADDPLARVLAALLGLDLDPALKVGLMCSPANTPETW